MGDARTEDDQGDWVCLVKGDEGGEELGRFMEANIRLDDAKATCDVWGKDPWSKPWDTTDNGWYECRWYYHSFYLRVLIVNTLSLEKHGVCII